MKLSISGKIAAAVAAFVFVSAEAEEYKLGNISDWQKSGGFVQHAPNILHGKGRIVAFSAKTFPYDPQKTYTFKGLYRQKPGSDSNIFRIGIVPLDENGKIIRTIDRSKLYNTQTPQAFKTELIKKAHEELKESNFTDDSSMLEELNIPVHIVIGSYSNIKITTKSDLDFAKLYI